jgi:hypothetical protein
MASMEKMFAKMMKAPSNKKTSGRAKKASGGAGFSMK